MCLLEYVLGGISVILTITHKLDSLGNGLLYTLCLLFIICILIIKGGPQLNICINFSKVIV